MSHISFPSTHTTRGKEDHDTMSTSGNDDHEAQGEDETKKIIQEMRQMIGGENK